MGKRTANHRAANLAELMEQLGGIPLVRVRLDPPPGTATEADVLAARNGPEGRICELVDGVLVEKPMSTPESIIAGHILRRIDNHIEEHDLGVVTGEAGMLRLGQGQVRAPDVSFLSWARIPSESVEVDQPIASLVPDLAVEVLSKSNTAAVIDRKLREYCFAGTCLAWVIDPRRQTAQVYTSPESYKRISKTGTLDASPVLTGFELSLADILASTRRRKKTG